MLSTNFPDSPRTLTGRSSRSLIENSTFLFECEYPAHAHMKTGFDNAERPVKSNIKPEMRSFKSKENIHKKKCGSYYVVLANKAFY